MKTMKTYHEFNDYLVQLDASEQIDESIIRPVTSVALVSKIRSLYKQIKSKNFSKKDEADVQLDKLFSKIDLL